MIHYQKDGGLAMAQYAAIKRQQGTMLWLIFANRLLGLICYVAGELDDAMDHYRAALVFCRKAGYGPELAWTQCDMGETLMARNRSGDLNRASAAFRDAIAISERLAMTPLWERASALLSPVERLLGRVVYPDGLTEREVGILQLISQGKSNQEIADQLIISVHTVIDHVRSIFVKTGSSNRAEATAYAARKSLLQ